MSLEDRNIYPARLSEARTRKAYISFSPGHSSKALAITFIRLRSTIMTSNRPLED